MAANNNCTLIGRLGRDIELSTTTTGKQLAKTSIAVDRPGRDQHGNKQTDWFNVKIFGKQAETAAQYLRKGSKVAIVGSIQIEKWNDRQSGQERQATVILGDGFQMLDPRQDDGQQQAYSQPAPAAAPPPPSAGYYADDDIPPF